MPRIVLLILVTCTALRWVAADPLAAFAMRIGATGQGPVCRLDAGTHTISTSLVIGRSDITLEGATENASDTTLVRAAGFVAKPDGHFRIARSTSRLDATVQLEGHVNGEPFPFRR